MTMQSSRDAGLRVLEAMAGLEHVYLMGGFAEDVLLGMGLAAGRSDIDLLVEEESWDELRKALSRIGVVGFEAAIKGPDGRVLAFSSHSADVTVEVWLTMPDGNGYALVLPGGRTGIFQLRLPENTFDYPKAVLEGIAVQTVSLRALCHLRAASAITRGDANRRSADLAKLQQLAGLLPAGADTAIVPDITELPSDADAT